MKILIAEDEAVSRRLLETTLRKLGHEVIAATNGRDAWAAYQEGGLHVVISDWMMPDLDGLELCRRIRAEGRMKYTYFILLTALSGKGRYLQGMEAGADDFIPKPFDRDELDARLRVAARILSLQEEVHQLEGLLPICSYCKKIHAEDDRWVQLEQYLDDRTDATFSHGICPECYQTRVLPEIAQWQADHKR